MGEPTAVGQRGDELLGLYDRALPQVYGYLAARCPGVALAEDLTSETFMAAVESIGRDVVDQVTVAWLVAIARHKLADHWRRSAREERRLRLVEQDTASLDDPWDVEIDAIRARQVLGDLGAHHRAALTLRYLDGLPVAEVAELLGRTLHATEALLVRARAAFRRAYGEGDGDETRGAGA